MDLVVLHSNSIHRTSQTSHSISSAHSKPSTALLLIPQTIQSKVQSDKMQFTSVLAVLSVALAASANPIVVERTGTPAQQAQQQCGNTATAKCCNSKKGLLTLGNCNDINCKAGTGFFKTVANCRSFSAGYPPFFRVQPHSAGCLLPQQRHTGTLTF